MLETTENLNMLDLMILPAFCVKENKIIKANSAAQELLPESGTLTSLLLSGEEEYAQFSGGCLYLQLNLGGIPRGASVTRMGDTDIFLLDPDEEDSELRAMALAARELRQPLSSLISMTETLFPHNLPECSEKAGVLLARMSRSLYQLQRLVGNMSDASAGPALARLETRNISQVFDDIFEKASAFLETIPVSLRYSGLKTDVCGLIDAAQMERAVWNILSNSLKFLPQGGTIQAEVTQRGNTLRLSIQDNGSGIQEEILGSMFSRYLRQPGLEDSRFGLGLGMVIVRNAAAIHGGTVLVDQPGQSGTRITLTMRLRRTAASQVCSPIADLAGGRDQALIELSQHLPISVYQKER